MADAPRWALLTLVQYLARLHPAGGTTERADVATIGVERAVEALEADVGALVGDCGVLAGVGFGSAAIPVQALRACVADGTPVVVEGIGPCHSVSVPLRGDGSHLVLAHAAAPFDADETMLAGAMAGVLVTSLRAADGLALERQLRAQSDRQAAEALLDPLTRLPNRTLFLDHFEQALATSARSGASVGVLFMDLDRFKLVNDSLGHLAGDSLLVQLADRIRAVVRTRTPSPGSGATSSPCSSKAPTPTWPAPWRSGCSRR